MLELVAGLEDAGRLPHRAGRAQGGLPGRVVAAGRRPGQAADAALPAARRQVHRLRAEPVRPVEPTASDQAGRRPDRLRPPAAALDEGRPPLHLPEGRPRPPALPARSRSMPTPARPATSSTRRPTRSSGPPTPRTSACRRSTGWTKTDEIIYASEQRRLAAPVPDRREDRARSRTRSRRASGSSAASTASTRRSGRSGSAPAARTPDQDPYFIHYYRVNFDGTGLVALTEGDGTHTVEFSPDRKYLDRHLLAASTWPPVHELRRVADGKLVCELEEADVAELKAERLGAAGGVRRQGPRRQDRHLGHHLPAARTSTRARSTRSSSTSTPGRRARSCPRRSAPSTRFASLTDLGFIVVQIDGMGTANRSKAFHDVCWKNLKDAGFPDRILWHKAVGREVPVLRHHAASASTAARPAGRTRPAACCSTRDFYKVGRRRLRLPRQPHGQGVVERAVDGLPGRPALRRVLEHRQRPPAARQAAADRRRAGHERAAGIDAARGGRADQGRTRTSTCWSCPAAATAWAGAYGDAADAGLLRPPPARASSRRTATRRHCEERPARLTASRALEH